MKRYNQRYLKSKNQGRILKLLYDEGPKSRAQIAKEIGIVPSTVSDIVNSFLEHNVVYQGRKVTGNVGKRPYLLYFNKNYYYFIIIVITSTEISLALCNLKGQIQAEDRISYSENLSAREIIDLAFHRTDKILSTIEKDKLILISLGSPETLNLETGEIKWAPYVQDWVGTDLYSLFGKRYGVEVIVKDHVKLETLGEHWKNYENVKNMVYIVITRGIGSGIIIDGKIREGKNGYLGEIAYMPIGERVEYEALKSETQGLGHFESQCDIKHIEGIVSEYLRNERNDDRNLTMEEIGRLYQTDEELRNLVNERIIKILALGIASVIIVLDPEIVVINGEIIQLGEPFLDLLKEQIFNIIPFQTVIVFSKLLERSRIYGAIRNGLNYIEESLYLDPEKFFEIKVGS